MHDSPFSNSTSTGLTVYKIFDAASDSSESLSKIKIVSCHNFNCSVCATTGPPIALLFTISWVAFDVTTLLASGPKPARFSDFDVTAPLSRGPHLARFWTKPEVQFHAFRRLKRGEKKGFEKKSFHVEISISLRIDLANKKKICHIHFKLDL